MFGVLVTVAFALCAAMAARFVLDRCTKSLDPAERFGVCGLLGLGSVGLLTLFVGLIPGGLNWGVYFIVVLVLALAVFGLVNGHHQELRLKLPTGLSLLFPLAVGVIGLLSLVAVLAPSVASDWDTLAYHLAVPKIWLQGGQIEYVQGIHHSNFPLSIDNLYIWGLMWGGQSGAKAFTLVVFVFGAIALFGLARRWYGGSAEWWCALGFAGIPVVAWETGTAYIDVAHGLFAAFGILYACSSIVKEENRKESIILAGLCLGFALGTKYTGFQVLVAVAAVVGMAGLFMRKPFVGVKTKIAIAVIALLVAAPWYVKTAVYTGNPVFPFFYGVLGGEDWDEWREATYKNEQQTFGVGRGENGRNPLAIGHAILGLAYQPGRYTNPGQEQGGGSPTGAIGFAVLVGAVMAAVSGRMSRREKLTLATIGLLLLMWFFLSQQSRYMTIVAIPMCVLGAGAIAKFGAGRIVAAAFILQAAYTAWMIKTVRTDAELQVVFGQQTAREYQAQRNLFYEPSQRLNQLPEDSKIALYHELFGFLLDRDYFWANPGHSKLIPHKTLSTGDEYASKMAELGFTHVYYNILGDSVGHGQKFVDSIGDGVFYSEDDRALMFDDLNLKFNWLIADAHRSGRLRIVATFPRSVLFEIVE
ncbi:MAG: hypothetical protein IH944_03815 [Armatimonadetes bacterium]|nr:hypothetical protein [Armatimonadota bacterium]